MRSFVSHSAAVLALSAMSTLLSASQARAEIGVIETVVEGFEDAAAAEERKKALDENVGNTLQSMRIDLALKCASGTYDVSPDARCVRDAVSEHGKSAVIDEVAQVVLKKVSPDKTVMKLRIFGRDGVPAPQPDEEIVDAQAFLAVTTAMLRKAFDPSRFAGTAIITGAPADAELLVDGLPIETKELSLRVGRHTLDVVHAGGAVERVLFEVQLDEPVTVPVPSALVTAPASAGAPFYASATTAGLGVAAVIGSVILIYIAGENRDEWNRRAIGRTFPRNSDDPRCQNTSGCVLTGPDRELDPRDDPNPDDVQIGWTRTYGPLGESAQVGQGARFMMVAYSRDNELRWATSANGGIGLAIAGGAALVGGAIATFVLWPSDAPNEAPLE